MALISLIIRSLIAACEINAPIIAAMKTPKFMEKSRVELSMTQEELWERFVDRSVLCVWIHRDVYVPVFQFDGGNHIPYFHDLWDILAPKCSSLEISQFFVSYRVEFSDLCIRDLLCEDLEVWQISAIVDNAKYFKNNELI